MKLRNTRIIGYRFKIYRNDTNTKVTRLTAGRGRFTRAIIFFAMLAPSIVYNIISVLSRNVLKSSLSLSLSLLFSRNRSTKQRKTNQESTTYSLCGNKRKQRGGKEKKKCNSEWGKDILTRFSIISKLLRWSTHERREKKETSIINSWNIEDEGWETFARIAGKRALPSRRTRDEIETNDRSGWEVRESGGKHRNRRQNILSTETGREGSMYSDYESNDRTGKRVLLYYLPGSVEHRRPATLISHKRKKDQLRLLSWSSVACTLATD